jgi:hypothetical protein
VLALIPDAEAPTGDAIAPPMLGPTPEEKSRRAEEQEERDFARLSHAERQNCRLLGLDKVPQDISEITRAYRQEAFKFHPDKQDQSDPEALDAASKHITKLGDARADLTEMVLRQTKMREQRDKQAEIAASIRRTRDMTAPWNVFVEKSQGIVEVPAPSSSVGAYVHTAKADDPSAPWEWPHATPAGVAGSSEERIARSTSLQVKSRILETLAIAC